MPSGFSITVLLLVAAIVLFIVAFVVSITDYGSHWAAWVSAGFAVFAAAHLPWRA
jgi:hypothetical protein